MDRCPARITFGGSTVHDLSPPRRTHYCLQVLPGHRLQHCTIRFGSSRRNPAPWPNNVRSSAYKFPANCPHDIATVVPEGHCPISGGDHHHQISIAPTRGPRFRATRFLQRLSMAHVGLTVCAGRRRNLIIVRPIFHGSTKALFGSSPLLHLMRCRLSPEVQLAALGSDIQR
jgi:hypothetical protein